MDDGIDYRLLAQNSVDMICFVGSDLRMSYASPSCEQILGWLPEEMCGKGPEVFVFEEDLPIVFAAQQRLMIHGVDDAPTTVRMRKKDGGFAWMEIYARLVRGEASGGIEAEGEGERSEIKGIVLTMRDITGRKLREETLESLSQVDGLTGLGNRRMFDQGLDREWKRAMRERTELSLLLLDVDYFKNLNDHHGHPYGDSCLQLVAGEVSRVATRAADVIARYGGEEIAVILPVTGAGGARQIAESICRGIAALRLAHDGRPEGDPWVTVSIGAASTRGWLESDLENPGAGEKMPKRLLKAADDALYQAKQQGRNCVVAVIVSQG
jgi:diguanylate cyclase (GGDEF)-like protein/PAS domain S-box-containing protein